MQSTRKFLETAKRGLEPLDLGSKPIPIYYKFLAQKLAIEGAYMGGYDEGFMTAGKGVTAVAEGIFAQGVDYHNEFAL